MFCKKCGKEINKGDKYCPFCGEPIEIEKKTSADSGKNTLLIAIGVVAVIVIAVAGFMVYNNSKATAVDLFSLSTEPEYEGYNGEGEIIKEVSLSEAASSKLVSEAKENRRDDIKAFLATVSFDVEPTKSLSNDDKIHVTATYDADLAKEKHIDIINNEGDYTVSGLEERPKDLSVAEIRGSGIVDEIWNTQPYLDGGYDCAYFGTDKNGKHKIFYISHFDSEYVDFDDNTYTETYYSIKNTNEFTSNINGIYMATEEIYGQTPKESMEQCLAVIKYEGYSLERI